MTKRVIFLVLIISTIIHADIFVKGNKNIGASIGAGSSYGNNYTIVGVYGNYFIADNLALGVGYRGWFGSSPQMHELLLEGTYYLPLDKKIHPYVGVFGRETFVSDYDDYQSYGVKGGIAFSTSKNSYVGVAYVLEYYSRCNDADECSNSYPEVVFGLSF